MNTEGLRTELVPREGELRDLVAVEQSMAVVRPLLKAERRDSRKRERLKIELSKPKLPKARRAAIEAEILELTADDRPTLSEQLVVHALFYADKDGNPEVKYGDADDLPFTVYQEVLRAVSKVHGLAALDDMVRRLEKIDKKLQAFKPNGTAEVPDEPGEPAASTH